MKRGALIGAVVGGAICFIVWVAWRFFGYLAGPETVVLWPSLVLLFGLEGSRSMVVVVTFWLVSSLANVALYSITGLAVAALYRLIRAV
jgi:hypothetical protein